MRNSILSFRRTIATVRSPGGGHVLAGIWDGVGSGGDRIRRRRPYDVTNACSIAVKPVATRTAIPDVDGDGEMEERRMRAEAVLLLSKSPVSARKLAQLARLADGTEARTMVRGLNQLYEEVGRAIRIELVAGGYRMLTHRALAPWLGRLGHLPPPVRLSPPMMETLTVVAYRQPVSRADVEAVRGVACGELLRQLLQRDLVRISGRGDELGRPYLYGTTKRFLQIYGLSSPEALPPIDWDGLQDDVADAPADAEAEQSDSSVNSSLSSPTPPQESVVSNTVAPAGPESFLDGGFSVAQPPVATHDQAGGVNPDQAAAVIEDEEDDLYEGRTEIDDEEEGLDDDYDADWGEDDEDDDDFADDDDDDFDDADEEESAWEEVGDDDEETDEDWDDGDEDETEADDDEDWGEEDDDSDDEDGDDDDDDEDWS